MNDDSAYLKIVLLMQHLTSHMKLPFFPPLLTSMVLILKEPYCPSGYSPERFSFEELVFFNKICIQIQLILHDAVIKYKLANGLRPNTYPVLTTIRALGFENENLLSMLHWNKVKVAPLVDEITVRNAQKDIIECNQYIMYHTYQILHLRSQITILSDDQKGFFFTHCEEILKKLLKIKRDWNMVNFNIDRILKEILAEEDVLRLLLDYVRLKYPHCHVDHCLKSSVINYECSLFSVFHVLCLPTVF